MVNKKGGMFQMVNKELIVHTKPKSIITEAIKTIRTNLTFSSVDEKLKSILVTSSVPSEGKSFISSNLAVAFSQTNMNVLIIDCDLRKGKLHKIFGVSNSKGLSNLLVEFDLENIDKYIKETKIQNVHIIPTGVTPPNPLEMLSSKRFAKLLKALEAEFDLVILDSSPVNIVSDAVVLTKNVNKVVVVTKSNKTTMKQLELTVKQIENASGKIAGVVLNNKKLKTKEYYNKYYR